MSKIQTSTFLEKDFKIYYLNSREDYLKIQKTLRKDLINRGFVS